MARYKMCSEAGCRRKAVSKGLCQTHYSRQWRQSKKSGTTTLPHDDLEPYSIDDEVLQALQWPKCAMIGCIKGAKYRNTFYQEPKYDFPLCREHAEELLVPTDNVEAVLRRIGPNTVFTDRIL